MKQRKVPERTCIVTKEKVPKQELVRVVKNKDGLIFIDLTGKANGRGAYLKKDIDVILKCQKNKLLDRHLECSIPNEIYEELKQLIIP